MRNTTNFGMKVATSEKALGSPVEKTTEAVLVFSPPVRRQP
jgi:hypothetical protein